MFKHIRDDLYLVALALMPFGAIQAFQLFSFN